MSAAGEDWRPTATPERLRLRAALLARTRAFFAARRVLEVDTPVLVNAAVTDPHIHSVTVDVSGGVPGLTAPQLYLHTSPEYAMKRLLAAGLGDIYQICHVARGFEQSRLHNSEFTLVEWYRLGFELPQLMDEVEALARELCAGHPAVQRPALRLSYHEAFARHCGLDPFTAPIAQLRGTVAHLGYQGQADDSRDALLDLIMGAVIGPALGQEAMTFIYGYPASQAVLARLDPLDPRTAQRFELYLSGVELANGFHELAAAEEQRARFAQDQRERGRRALPVHRMDERLLAALAAGLPECSGVAVGFDRVLMLAAGAAHISEVLPFPTATA